MVHHGELKVRDHALCVCSLSATAEREFIPGAIEKPDYNGLGLRHKAQIEHGNQQEDLRAP